MCECMLYDATRVTCVIYTWDCTIYEATRLTYIICTSKCTLCDALRLIEYMYVNANVRKLLR